MATNNMTRYRRPLGATPLSEAMDQLFRDAFTWPHTFRPGTAMGQGEGTGLNSNLYELPDSYIMQIVLPAVQIETLHITAQQNILTLQGTAGVAAPEGGKAIWVSLGAGEFREQVTLPGEVDADRASAEYRDGILILTLPKAEHARVKTIKVSGQQTAIEGQTTEIKKGK